LDALLTEQHRMLPALDRAITLRDTAALVRGAAGSAAGLVAEVGGDSRAVIRGLSGTRTSALRDLVVPAGQGVGGRVLVTGRPVRISDYVSSHSITHQFDALAEIEAMSGMLAVPITADGSRAGAIVAIAYAALRERGDFGDDAVRAVERVAAAASHALRLADRAAEDRLTAVSAERMRLQGELHDSVGSMLFSIGAQVRDLQAGTTAQSPLGGRLARLESDIAAASVALRDALLALSEAGPERALPTELAEHCRSFEARTGLVARFVQLGPVDPLDVERSALLISAVREGLLNAEKHANAATVIVSLGTVEGGVQVAVIDDGRPAPAADGQTDVGPGAGLGIGLLAIKAARLGGHADIVHNDDGGVTLRVVLPVRP
jgi:signal transduction histidine kinase